MKYVGICCLRRVLIYSVWGWEYERYCNTNDGNVFNAPLFALMFIRRVRDNVEILFCDISQMSNCQSISTEPYEMIEFLYSSLYFVQCFICHVEFKA